LAIAASAGARPGEHGGGGGGPRAQAIQPHGGGGGGGGATRAQAFQAPRAERQAFAAPRMERQAFASPRMQRQSFAAPPVQRQAFAAPRMQREQRTAAIQRPQRAERMSMATRPTRANRVQQAQAMHANNVQQAANRQQLRANRVQQAQAQRVNRVQQAQAQRVNRVQQAQAQRVNRVQQSQTQLAARQQLQGNRGFEAQNRMNARQQLQTSRAVAFQDRTAARNQFAARAALVTPRVDTVRAMAAVPQQLLPARTQVIPMGQAVRYVGQPISTVTPLVQLGALPASVQYLYPDTPNYYYQYGDGYVYQVDRTSSLISALLPLLGGGYMPGSYLPASYMSSYAPDYYGLNSFYPADYGYDTSGYYGNMCNRYANGVIYQVDCMSGMVENVIPMYAGGYGVGQMLPTAYDTYNLPYQYRSMYYPTSDYSYWYAPGAIYQVDPSSSMITSVAALLSPGFSVGQPLPMGYDAYNVPYAYRSTYYDTPNAWYRYNNGYIYQVDPATQLVTAIVASLLT
jgi:hypothetical protein